MIKIPHEELVRHVDELRSLEFTAKKFGCCAVTVLQALRRAGLKSRGRLKARKNPKCSRCGCSDPEQFNKRCGPKHRLNPNGVWCAWCKQCYIDEGRDFKHRTRQRIVEFLGGKCAICDFSKYVSALDVHHADPTKKHPSFNNILGWKWERVEKEIVDCVLLCANCHRGHHNGELSADALAKLADAIEHRVRPYTPDDQSQHKILNNLAA
jgi:hypothetical protein